MCVHHWPAERATRYDKLAVRYEATVHIAAINEWLRPALKHALALRRAAPPNAAARAFPLNCISGQLALRIVSERRSTHHPLPQARRYWATSGVSSRSPL